MARRSYAGGAQPTTLAGELNTSATSFTVANGAGYPDGVNGPFYVALARGKASEEKVLVSARAGNVFTVPLANRGQDGTSIQTHPAGTTVEHVFTAVDADEANAHANGDVAAHSAAAVTFTPTGTIAATTVQAALAELDSEKSATGHTHAAGVVTKTIREARTFSFSGAGSALTTSVKAGFFVDAPAGQTANIVGARAVVVGGTSVVAALARNGSNLVTPTVTTTAADVAVTQALSDNDLITLSLTTVTGVVTEVYFTVFVDVVV